jgi:5'-methylthioadenosine phosphorylase
VQTGESSAGVIGIFGGSGLYDFAGLDDVRETPVSTPFGAPSAPPMVGQYAGRTVVFIPRHGRGHRLLPSEVNYRANVYAFRQLGVTQVISVSAVGSMKEEIRPGDFVLVDQFVDRTHKRASTFFGEGCVGHVAFADPVCAELSAVVAEGARQAALDGHTVHLGGAYLCIEGPQFSTRAESNIYRSFGVSVIGMTGATEAKLCREAELCFSLLALATDYDCWHPEEAHVTATAVLEVMKANVAAAQETLRLSLPQLPTGRRCGCGSAARHAVLTSRDHISPESKERLRGLYGRYFE